MNFSPAFPKPRRPGTKPRSKPSELHSCKATNQNHPETPDGQAASTMPAFPPQGLPRQGHVGENPPPQSPGGSTTWPSAPSLWPAQPCQQHPLVFVYEQKKSPPAPATETAAASASHATAADATSLPTPIPVTTQAASKANPQGFLDKSSKPGCAVTPSDHSTFAPAAQQSPRVENCQQRSKNPPLLPFPPVPSWLPVTPEESQGATGAGVPPSCLEIISLKEGFTITTFPKSNQSHPPRVGITVRAQAQRPPVAVRRDPPKTLGAHGGTEGRAPRSAPMPGAKWVHKIL
nr:vegetative cell wall protein gp1-like isoform X2 [Columba livia]